MDPNFGLQLGGEKIQERIRSFKEKPEELMKLVNESAALESFSKMFVDLFLVLAKSLGVGLFDIVCCSSQAAPSLWGI